MTIARLTLLIPILAGCMAEAPPEGASGTGSTGDEVTTTPPTMDEIANATIPDIYDEPIQLVDGRYEGPPLQADGSRRPTVYLSQRLIAYADIDGDGEEEAAALMDENSGGTGRFSYLGVFERDGAGVRTLAVVRLDDRIQVRSLSGEADRFLVDAIAGGPTDAACCPTMKTLYRASMTDGDLTVAREQLEPVGLSDLAGVTWRLERFGLSEAPVEVQVTLEVDPDGAVSGSAGCNNYSGQVTSDPAGTSFEVGPMAVTQRMCPPEQMDVEDRFLSAMGTVTGYSWSQGQLQLAYDQDGEFQALHFDPAPR
jgi:heat shock protein HslJ